MAASLLQWSRARASVETTAGLLRPQPLAVAGEALVQPDVAPGRQRERVAEPLVRQLVRDEAHVVPVGAQEVGPEGRHPLCFQGNLEAIVRDHHGVGGERVRTEQSGVEVQHLGLPTERGVVAVEQPMREHRAHRDGRPLDGVQHVAADLHRGEIGRHRLTLLVDPRGRAGRAPLAGAHAVGDDVVGVGRRQLDPVGRLVVGTVVAGEPGRRPVGLARDEHAVGELLPAAIRRRRPPQVAAGRCRRPRHGRSCRPRSAASVERAGAATSPPTASVRRRR